MIFFSDTAPKFEAMLLAYFPILTVNAVVVSAGIVALGPLLTNLEESKVR